MKCPFCGHADTQVVDSRANDDADAIRRRRRCLACEKRFTTWETVELRMPQVVKSSGMRSDFSVDKLRTGFSRALHKRPVAAADVDAAIDRIKQRLLGMATREVPSTQIGQLVMQELKRLDKVAYIRFASVYRSFEDVDDFRDAIEEVTQPTRSGRRRPPPAH
ncbi:MAG: transcriptional regulator NrdR [Burkholderiales bacterium]|nr:transcriptional regulator NrdR [Burkholderiales bacterium]